MRRFWPEVLVTNAQGPLQQTSGETTARSLYCTQVLACVRKKTAGQRIGVDSRQARCNVGYTLLLVIGGFRGLLHTCTNTQLVHACSHRSHCWCCNGSSKH
jgi:hypothetical protein